MKKYYVDITRKYTFIKINQTKESYTNIYLYLTAIAVQIGQLLKIYQCCNNLQNDNNIKIFKLSCTISKILYTFVHKLTASYRERLF